MSLGTQIQQGYQGSLIISLLLEIVGYRPRKTRSFGPSCGKNPPEPLVEFVKEAENMILLLHCSEYWDEIRVSFGRLGGNNYIRNGASFMRLPCLGIRFLV